MEGGGKEEGGREKKALFIEIPWHYQAAVAMQGQGPQPH